MAVRVLRPQSLSVMLLVLAVLVSAALACSPGKPEPTATPIPAPAPAPTSAPTPQPAEEEPGKGESTGSPVTLTLVNDLEATLCYVFISPPAEDTWGEDWLGSDEVVPPGGQRSFSVDAGEWDVMAADCDSNELASQFGLSLTADAAWPLSAHATQAGDSGKTADEPQPYTLANNGSIDICAVYISPTTSDTWGEDWLGGDIIAAGTQYTFYVTPGTYDLLMEDCTGNTLDQQMGVVLYGGEIWNFGGGGASRDDTMPVTVHLVNNAGIAIYYVWYGPPTSEWIGDLLGDSILEPGMDLAVEIPYGIWVLQAEDADGNVVAVYDGFAPYEGARWEITP